MTDKEKIREEVERLFNDIKDSNFESDSGAFYYLKDLLDYIDSLQEEPVSIWHDAKISVPEDSSLDILCIEEDGYARIGKGKVLSGTTKWSYVNDLLNLTNTVTKISEQEEPVSVGLEEAVKNRDEYKEWQGSPDIQKELIDFAKFGNQYKEPVSEDLGEYINELSKQFPEMSFAKLSRIAVRVAKWQKEQSEKNRLAACDKQTEEEAARLHVIETRGDDVVWGENAVCAMLDFKAGAKWKEQQMMTKAIDASCIYRFPRSALFSFNLPADKYLVGSEVKVIIFKED